MEVGLLFKSPMFIALLLVLFLPASVSAVNLQGDLRTYLQLRETAENDSIMPLHEYIDLSADNFGREEISFHLGAWVRQDLNANTSFDGKSFNSDLQYAYINLHQINANTYFNAGRVLVFEGIASELVDGVSAGTDLTGGFGLSAYGGLPVASDFDGRKGDTIFGGRVSHEIPDRYRIGISYLKERNDGSDFREEAGVDLRVRPHEMLEVYGQSTYNAKTSGWMEQAYYITLRPSQALRLGAEISSTQYKDYFASVDSETTSVFNLGQGILDPGERLRTLGGRAEYALREDFTLTANYKALRYKIADPADYYGGGLLYSGSNELGAGAAIYRMAGRDDRFRYLESRLYGYGTRGKINLAVDLFHVNYNHEINGVKNAYTASMAMGYPLTEATRAAADLSFSRNPDFDNEVEVFIKLVHRFALAFQSIAQSENAERPSTQKSASPE